MPTRARALSLILALFLASCTGTPDVQKDSVEDVTAAIKATYADMVDAMAAGEIAEMVAFAYTADARFHPPQAGPVEGHEAITAALSAILESGIQVVSSPVYVDVFSDSAFEYGTAELTMPDGQVVVDTYVVLWKKESGSWKMHRDFVNGTTP